MAEFNWLAPPEALVLTCNLAQNFKIFEQSYNVVMSATGLNAKDKSLKRNILLHVLEEEALKSYTGFIIEDGKEDDPEFILCRPKEYF